MKALVVGCGGAGRRHVKNLCGMKSVEGIVVVSRRADCLAGVDVQEKTVRIIPSLRNNVRADFAVICNETSAHLETAMILAEKGIHILIEKPLSVDVTGIDALKQVASANRVKICVGYNVRRMGAVQHVHRRIMSGDLGKLYFARIEVGQHLSQWRPGRDPKDSYSVRVSRGGGVALDLSHEIDYMRYLFGEPVSWRILERRVDDVTVDSPDLFEGLYSFADGFICSVHMDYLEAVRRRGMRVVGHDGEVVCNLADKYIEERISSRKSVTRRGALFDMESTYKSELQDFIADVQGNNPVAVSLDDAAATLALLKENHV